MQYAIRALARKERVKLCGVYTKQCICRWRIRQGADSIHASAVGVNVSLFGILWRGKIMKVRQYPVELIAMREVLRNRARAVPRLLNYGGAKHVPPTNKGCHAARYGRVQGPVR